jgi:deoxyribonuclease-1
MIVPIRLLVALFSCWLAYGPLSAQEHPQNFRAAKKALAELHRESHTTFYCGCNYRIQDRQSDAIDMASCGLKHRKNLNRADNLEWEHIVPFSWFYQGRLCATASFRKENCTSSGGKVKSARKCCAKTDESAKRFESDLFNLRPAAGEINGDRSNRGYGEIADEIRKYGTCDFEVDFENKLAEPPPGVRGDVARVIFYMLETYGLRVSAEELAMYQRWDLADAVDSVERDLAERTAVVQGNKNRYVTP